MRPHSLPLWQQRNCGWELIHSRSWKNKSEQTDSVEEKKKQVACLTAHSMLNIYWSHLPWIDASFSFLNQMNDNNSPSPSCGYFKHNYSITLIQECRQFTVQTDDNCTVNYLLCSIMISTNVCVGVCMCTQVGICIIFRCYCQMTWWKAIPLYKSAPFRPSSTVSSVILHLDFLSFRQISGTFTNHCHVKLNTVRSSVFFFFPGILNCQY